MITVGQRRTLTLKDTLFSYKQGTQPIDQYVTELKCRAKSCELGSLESSLLTTCLIVGIITERLPDRLLQISDLDLKKAIQICHIDETSQQQLKEMQGEDGTKSINAIAKPKNKQRVDKRKPCSMLKNNYKNQEDKQACLYCGSTHPPRKCLAYKHQCKKLSHFE